jgi:hypothetical protein
LNGIGALQPATGVKLKLRITTSVTNTTAITSVYVSTFTNLTAQANYYPLDTNTLTLTGLLAGSDVVILAAGTETVRDSADSVASYSYVYGALETVDIAVYKAGYIPFFVRGYALIRSDVSLPIAQVVDRAYLA